MNDPASTVAGVPPAEATGRLKADAAGIARAAELIRSGRLVAFPTETVYGLGADAANPAAVAAIFAAKERPRFNPLIAHLPDAETARREGRFDGIAERLARAFWPGPLTLVVPAAPEGRVCDLARAGLRSVALRVPESGIARDLIAAVGRPVAAPSANRSGRVSPTRAEHVRADLDGRLAAILDGGACPIGVESTVVACLDGVPRLLRPGGITRRALEDVLGRRVEGPAEDAAEKPVGPGLLASHYAPRARLRLGAARIAPGEAALLFGGARPPGLTDAVGWLDLSATGDLAEAAAGLFAALRFLDAMGTAVIAAVPIPQEGLGEAINDRLARAAAPR
ncbi:MULTISPECIES: L-threonylcarbamoyladenylate synthase [Methylobacterium]|uniref:Threonylcarbamoyl-AMP synthase n=2 Tax=Pseudomonadota TaxID=1224 RepID=A0ABQ4SXE5_9HYPH|nr:MULTISPECIES: L-threonylcarbamoyladenylate synthase [Methylobacterium]PIU08759.1 MAG: threonylcarbamoyl-AMP synthase [Methylobacterium sp. CG09_land_8_20_14_0_10_71_15]PIU16371.1 MAG: threonylcarbamoyl-AMP synthase [Methylobacterium sp. CG08_land_8_20_14_0_20_71_15]GBU16059.1 threonylcarbamoyl-AMP synthase [Methylobacterium sp.]GJE07219.1 Threonylcarbamoyl-AMP synthase [Methylobacterium jeotgali]